MNLTKTINFTTPWNTRTAYSTLVYCIASSFDYNQTAKLLADINVYISKEQYTAFNTLWNIDLEQNINTKLEKFHD